MKEMREKERIKIKREKEEKGVNKLALLLVFVMGFYEPVLFVLRPLYRADKGLH